MSEQPYRNSTGGMIDRSRPINFTFNGRRYQGYQGDTLASALLANGVHLVGRSFKYHRPRGIFAAGVEEPNALVQLRSGARTEPNTRATEIELFDGLEANSQNCWPSVKFDFRAATGWFSRLMPAGFYYKTFMWPRSLWMTYERFIRDTVGLGKAPTEADPDRYDKRFAHCDVLVVGGGPAGLAAALTAARKGARVILAELDAEFGGALHTEHARIDSKPALSWVKDTLAELQALPKVTLLPRTTVFGYYDHNLLGMVEHVADHLPQPNANQPRQRLWKVRAQQVVLATGAIERPLVFANNDRPGIMLASAARTYVNRYGVRPGSRAVLFTNNDSAYATALDLQAAGIEVAALIDVRPEAEIAAAPQALQAGIPCHFQSAISATLGTKRVKAIELAHLNSEGTAFVGRPQRISCDLLCVSGGWNPTLHLYSQSRGKPVYDPAIASFVPGESIQSECSVGAARGRFRLVDCLSDGVRAGAEAADAVDCGHGRGLTVVPVSESAEVSTSPKALWRVPLRGPKGKLLGKCFVDLQSDVTTNDIELAAREGYTSVEHVKRYTALGMGTDQGKTSNINGLGILAELRKCDIPSVGTTTFRPFYTAVTLGALAGRESAERFDPVRQSPMHDWHRRAGAVFMPSGLWFRPKYYPRQGETMNDAVQREARAVRDNVGLVDVSTLGKIDVQGKDAAEFLNRVYINEWKTLKVGRARYGVMLREDGIVFDDGTTARLGENHFHLTTTTSNAGRVMDHLEFHQQQVWPELEVYLTSVTDQWAAMALSGPNSREVLARAFSDLDVGNEALPFMGFIEAELDGIQARIFRISFSGERAYEINVPAGYGLQAWEALMAAGKSFDITPYGLEAMEVLRIEKGHLVIGAEIDGRISPIDLGFERMLSQSKEFIGKGALARPAFHESNRQQLVGLLPVDGRTMIPIGAQLVDGPAPHQPGAGQGRVTSTHFSPTLASPIALALLAGGRGRENQELYAVSPLTNEQVRVRVTQPMFHDPKGELLRG